jgi:hypothetical protein
MGKALQLRNFDPVATPEIMAAWITQFSPISDAEALKLLRARFPDRPLSMRVAALGFLTRNRGGPSAARD